VYRKLITIALCLAVIPAPALASSEPWREQSEKVVDAGALKGVRVENARGLITARRGDRSNLRLTAVKIARGRDREQAMKFARETQVTTATEDGRFVVRVRYPQRQMLRVSFFDLFGGFEFPRVEVRLALEVPGGMPVWLNSTSGDLETESLSGTQSLGTTSGDVTVLGAAGALEVSTVSGDIQASDVASARFRTVSGDVRLNQAKGPLSVHTTSGEIDVSGGTDSLSLASVSGGIRVDGAPRGVVAQSTSGDVTIGPAAGVVRTETSSGDVRVELRSPLGRAEISTASGDIEVDLGGTLGCSLDMRTSNGTLDTDVPLEVQTVSRRMVTGIVRRGTAPVHLRSSSGDITVRGGGN
jgi:DUF4097 and DUF4098 domain-containing protein YvlB